MRAKGALETDGRSNGDDNALPPEGRCRWREHRRDCVRVTVRLGARLVCQTTTDSDVGHDLHAGGLSDRRFEKLVGTESTGGCSTYRPPTYVRTTMMSTTR